MNKKRVLFKFFEPIVGPIAGICALHAIISFFFVLGWLIGPQGDTMPTSMLWGLIYPGLVYIFIFGSACIVSLIGWLIGHYKKCVNEVYCEEHNIRHYCKVGYDHRLYHAIGRKCPCRK